MVQIPVPEGNPTRLRRPAALFCSAAGPASRCNACRRMPLSLLLLLAPRLPSSQPGCPHPNQNRQRAPMMICCKTCRPSSIQAQKTQKTHLDGIRVERRLVGDIVEAPLTLLLLQGEGKLGGACEQQARGGGRDAVQGKCSW